MTMTSSPEDDLVERFRTAVVDKDYPYQTGMLIALVRRLAIPGHPELEWAQRVAQRIVVIWEAR